MRLRSLLVLREFSYNTQNALQLIGISLAWGGVITAAAIFASRNQEICV